MRILDEVNDKSLSSVTIYLTHAQASEMRDSLESILGGSHHEHISDFEANKEITVCVYGKENMHEFDKRSRRLIDEDK